jgi:hypothetical protein
MKFSDIMSKKQLTPLGVLILLAALPGFVPDTRANPQAACGCGTLVLPPSPSNSIAFTLSWAYPPAASSSFLTVTMLGGGALPSGVYASWCADAQTALLPGVEGYGYTAHVYSSSDTNLNGYLNSETSNTNVLVGPVVWNEVNYILNHRAGYNYWDVQGAIWHFIGGPAVATPPYPFFNVAAVSQLVNDALANAPAWVPQMGDVVAGVAAINWAVDNQIVIVELPCPGLTPAIAVSVNCPADCGLVDLSGSVSNSGGVTLTNVQVFSTQPGDYTPLLGPISLAPGASATFTGNYTVPCVTNLTTNTVSIVTTNTVGVVTTNTVLVVTTNTLPVITTNTLSVVTTNTVPVITTNTLSVVTTNTVPVITTNTVGVVTTNTVPVVTTNSVAVVTTNTVPVITTNTVLVVTTNTVPVITTNTLSVVTTNTVPVITTNTVGVVTTNTVPVITTNTVLVVTTNTVPVVTTNTVALVTTNTVPVITTNTVLVVTTNTVPVITTNTVLVVTTNTVPVVTTNTVALVTTNFVTDIVTNTTSTVGTNEVNLGTANNFSVLAGSTITSTGATAINGGNVGVSPGSAITGFPPATVTPPYTTFSAGAVPAQAETDLTAAYNTAAGLAPTRVLTGTDLGGLTLTPGVYFFSSSAQLTGTLTLNDQGNPDAVFVFQIGSTLTTASASSVVTINAGGSSTPGMSVFWQVGSSATLGTTTAFEGNILALASITADTGATDLDGRLLAINGAVTMDGNAVTAPPAEVLTITVTNYTTNTVASYITNDVTSFITNDVTSFTTNSVTSFATNNVISFTTNHVTTFATNNVITFSTNSVISFITNSVTSFTTNSVTSFATNNVISFTTNNVTSFTTNNVTSFTTNSVISFTTNNVISFITNNVTSFATNSVISFTTNNVITFTTNSVTSFTTNSVISFTTNNVISFTTNNVTSFTTNSVTSFTTNSVTSFATNNITSFSTNSVTSYSTNNVTSFSTNIVTRFSTNIMTGAMTNTVTAIGTDACQGRAVAAVAICAGSGGQPALLIGGGGSPSPHFSNGNFSMSFATQNGVSYTVQYKTAWSDPIWTDLQTVSGTGGCVTVSHALAGQASCFYRVVISP